MNYADCAAVYMPVIDSLAKLSFFDKFRNICNFYPPKALASIPNIAQMTILRD
jgi:hypothetical protein